MAEFQRGLVETFEITTPFQMSYSFTLKSSTGAIHHRRAQFASTKPHFAFQNISMATVLTKRRVVGSPRSHWFATVKIALGPFGSIDAYHVPFSLPLVTLLWKVQTILTANALTISDKPLVELIHSVQSAEFMSTWSNSSRHFSAGNIICDYTSSPGSTDRTVKGSFTSDGDCVGVKSNVIYASRMQILFAALAWHIQWPHEALDIQFICALNANACVDDLTNTLLWATAETGNVSMIQFEAKSRQLLLLTLFGSKSIANTGWMLLYEWVVGVREVVAFAGDANVKWQVMSEYAIAYSSGVLALIGFSTWAMVAANRYAVDTGNLFNSTESRAWCG
ncbi:hypothetical protein H257_10238 [Aphanomyces astaci]|uniref:Uncharacterized protein n=1 Tax=Aphanomyces astaci TaxID=112090 RepID=W4G6Q2_APHAT|nr:hypothetical protein H257_10238 [Aphanomyces astaci]ETV75387.1 hypothetical protein H257_10238 [Aphanomyces astaci]|eukprot:XP_009835021.1 hypothetical protein H257_10238 [Aphanomyces astaci]